ncbi:hypothetical protein CYMTET_19699 [Cymbomonas tetramitiformis]|uniref:Uncharacterized protein n=1 Tax=Cymbomonas tetramitiformis TaxID=36881 RepID=A0AAE0G625_9CHLO|nr:hypothetical protein CYMTET_19699 [Cymbomonas tetramitiformis]
MRHRPQITPISPHLPPPFPRPPLTLRPSSTPSFSTPVLLLEPTRSHIKLPTSSPPAQAHLTHLSPSPPLYRPTPIPTTDPTFATLPPIIPPPPLQYSAVELEVVFAAGELPPDFSLHYAATLKLVGGTGMEVVSAEVIGTSTVKNSLGQDATSVQARVVLPYPRVAQGYSIEVQAHFEDIISADNYYDPLGAHSLVQVSVYSDLGETLSSEWNVLYEDGTKAVWSIPPPPPSTADEGFITGGDVMSYGIVFLSAVVGLFTMLGVYMLLWNRGVEKSLERKRARERLELEENIQKHNEEQKRLAEEEAMRPSIPSLEEKAPEAPALARMVRRGSMSVMNRAKRMSTFLTRKTPSPSDAQWAVPAREGLSTPDVNQERVHPEPFTVPSEELLDVPDGHLSNRI